MANIKWKGLKDIEYDCLERHRHVLEKNLNSVRVVSSLVDWGVLNNNEQRHIIGTSHNQAIQNQRLIDTLLQDGTSKDFAFFLRALKELKHEREYQLLQDYLQQSNFTVSRPKQIKAIGTCDNPLTFIMDKLTQIDEKLSDQHMEKEMKLQSAVQQINDLEEDLDAIRKNIDELREAERQGKGMEERMQRTKETLESLEARLTSLDLRNADSQERQQQQQQRIRNLGYKLNRLYRRFETVEDKLDLVQDRMGRMEERTDRVEDRVERVEGRTDRVEDKVERLEQTVQSQTNCIELLLKQSQEPREGVVNVEQQHFSRELEKKPSSGTLPSPPPTGGLSPIRKFPHYRKPVPPIPKRRK